MVHPWRIKASNPTSKCRSRRTITSTAAIRRSTRPLKCWARSSEHGARHQIFSAQPLTIMLRWRIAILISAAIAISYLDRQTLPVAIGAIREDIPISNQVKAFLDSAFLLTYGLMYLGGGRLMD